MAILGVHTLAVAPAWTPAAARRFLPWLKEYGVELMEVPLLRPEEIDISGTRAVASEFDIQLACSLGLPDSIDSTGDPDSAIAFLTRALEVTASIEAIALSGVTYSSIGKTSGAPPTVRERDAVARIIEGRCPRGAGARLEARNRALQSLRDPPCQHRGGWGRGDRAGRSAERVRASRLVPHEHRGGGDGARYRRARARILATSMPRRATGGLPGRGTLDWAGLCQGLAESEFEGPVVLESFVHLDPDIAAGLAVWRPVAEQPEEVIEVGIPFLREHAAAAGLGL